MIDPNDELDDLLRAAARDYNRPGATPRDRMWESIRGQRARRVAMQRPTMWRRSVLSAAAAAVLLIGVLIGRMYERTVSTQPRVTDVADAAPPDAGRSAPDSESPTPSPLSSVPPHKDADVTRDAGPAARRTHHAARVHDPARQNVPNLAFRLAVVEHLAGTEALLTSFRDEAARGDVDTQITSWARKLLTTTRLLQSAAAQQDPTMKRLLDDLELVLVQIAQYSPTSPHRTEELEFIEHSIQRRGVIGKLRTTVSARLVPSGT